MSKEKKSSKADKFQTQNDGSETKIKRSVNEISGVLDRWVDRGIDVANFELDSV